MTKIEIINETVAFYSEDPKRRSVNQYGACVYNGENDTHCAVGRCFLTEIKDQGENYIYNAEVGIGDFKHRDINLDDLLEEKYKGHVILFWQKLQSFHDYDLNFNKTGLTDTGRKEVKNLLTLFAE